jgi:uncharacterized protein CbrC (UPF0167 family)
MNIDKPFFRFNPSAYEPDRSFEASDDICDACSKPCVWKHKGSVYGRRKPVVCARCISDGSIAKYFAGEHFSFHDIQFSEPSDLATEVLERTPGVSCFNPFVWPVVNGRPLAFIAYGDEAAFASIPGVQAAITAVFSDIGWSYDGAGTPYALVFKDLEADFYQALIDLD